MFLTQLNDLNAQVQTQLKAARLPVNPLETGLFRLPTMNLVKPDHSSIVASIPVHKFNLARDDNALNSTSDYANAIVRFVLDTANEFTHPRISITPAYVNYAPRLSISDWSTISFNIAIWEYDQSEIRWLEMPSDPARKGHNFGAKSFDPQIAFERHQLLKTAPFEVNIWTSNIVRDITQTSLTGGSTLQLLIKLEKDLLSGAQAAAESLHKMQRAASVHDAVAGLFRFGKYEQASTVLSEALKMPVTVFLMGIEVALMIDNLLYRPDQVFALVAGLNVEGSPTPEDKGFWKYSEPTEADLAKAKAVGLNLDYTKAHHGRH